VEGWVELSSGTGGTTMILSVPLNPPVFADIPTATAQDGDDPSQWGDL
jgi:hypothetical protein